MHYHLLSNFTQQKEINVACRSSRSSAMFSRGGSFDVHYWRERNHEVDFVVEEHKRLTAGALIFSSSGAGAARAKNGFRAARARFSS
jgi:hypothetical protein